MLKGQKNLPIRIDIGPGGYGAGLNRVLMNQKENWHIAPTLRAQRVA